jgi:hypothetical protein
MDLHHTISAIEKELEFSGLNKQRERYLTGYLSELIKYSEKHPGTTQVPSPLELFCDDNPDALECRIHDN